MASVSFTAAAKMQGTSKFEKANKSFSSSNLCMNEEALAILKCCFCDKYLSVPPIFSSDKENICGRCKFVDKSKDVKWYRQVVFEALAQYMIFPCSNLIYGCKARLKWDQVEEHENTCIYKKLKCPLFDGDILFNTDTCKWIGSGPSLNEHLETCHADLIKKLRPEMNFSELTESSILFTRIAKQLIMIVILYRKPQEFSCVIMVNGTSTDCDSFRYQLELYDSNRNSSLFVRRNRLEDAIGFEENIIDEDKMLTVDLTAIKSLLINATTIMGRFVIVKKSKKGCYNYNQSEVSVIDDNILRDLECPICKSYLIPPVHICNSGHSLCAKCKSQLQLCPTCRSPFQEGRNYTLEKITASLNYPCMYKEAGCSVTCHSERLKEHEQDCSFSGSQCFLNCSSHSVINMFKHLTEKHNDCLIISGELNIFDVSDNAEEEKYYGMCFGNDLFRLSASYDGDMAKFSLQQFGVDNVFYYYKLEIICSTETNETLILTKECIPINDDFFENAVSLPVEMIYGFISEEYLIFFKIHLKKIENA